MRSPPDDGTVWCPGAPQRQLAADRQTGPGALFSFPPIRCALGKQTACTEPTKVLGDQDVFRTNLAPECSCPWAHQNVEGMISRYPFRRFDRYIINKSSAAPIKP